MYQYPNTDLVNLASAVSVEAVLPWPLASTEGLPEDENRRLSIFGKALNLLQDRPSDVGPLQKLRMQVHLHKRWVRKALKGERSCLLPVIERWVPWKSLELVHPRSRDGWDAHAVTDEHYDVFGHVCIDVGVDVKTVVELLGTQVLPVLSTCKDLRRPLCFTSNVPRTTIPSVCSMDSSPSMLEQQKIAKKKTKKDIVMLWTGMNWSDVSIRRVYS